MDGRCLVLVLFGLVCTVSASLKIKELKVPASIRSGSTDAVVLDCDFEAEGEKGLEVRWYYNSNADIIYQWLPQQRDRLPQALGDFKDKVDIRYKASNDTITMHRALYITDVSPDISGNYMCKVSSDYSEDVKAKNMIVYEPAEEVNFVLVPEGENVTIICSASGLRPKPQMTILAAEGNATLEVEEADLKEEDGLYNITLVYKATDIAGSTQFECHLTIPDTDYHVLKSEMFYPEIEDIYTDYAFSSNFTNSSIYYDERAEVVNIDGNDENIEQTNTTQVNDATRRSIAIVPLFLISLWHLVSK